MGSTNLVKAGALAAGVALSALCPACPARAGPMFNLLNNMSEQPQGFGHVLAPLGWADGRLASFSELANEYDLLGPAVGSEYFTVDTNSGTVFFLGGIFADPSNHLDLEGPLSLDELDGFASAKPAGLAMLGASLLGIGLLSRRKF